MPRYPTVPLFDDVMGTPVPTLQAGAEEQRDALAAWSERVCPKCGHAEDRRDGDPCSSCQGKGDLPPVHDALAAATRDHQDLAHRAWVANQVGGVDLFNVPAEARAMLERDPAAFGYEVAHFCELERLSGYKTDAHRACRAIAEEVGA